MPRLSTTTTVARLLTTSVSKLLTAVLEFVNVVQDVEKIRPNRSLCLKPSFVARREESPEPPPVDTAVLHNIQGPFEMFFFP